MTTMASAPGPERTKRSKAPQHLIFVSMEDWDETWRRNQFVCAELARKDAERKILFVGVQRNLLRSLLKGAWQKLLRHPTWQVPAFPNITVTTALRVMPERYEWGRKFNEWLTRRHLRREAARLNFHAPVLWLNPHYAVHLAGQMEESALLYDITDDWEKLEQPAKLTATVRAQDAELGRRADAVIVCSQALRKAKVAKFGRAVHLIPNGVHAEHYRTVLDRSRPLPVEANAWTKPVLGYTGTVHSQRVDVELIAALAEKFAHGTIALVGPDMLEETHRRKLAQYSNVRLVGAVPYAGIPDWMRAFDVCIVPHQVTEFTESLNPIKLWEYFAAGKPIVSTPVAGFREFPHLVRLASGAADFTVAVEEALLEGEALAEARQAEAQNHSWEQRVNEIEEIIQTCLTPRPS